MEITFNYVNEGIMRSQVWGSNDVAAFEARDVMQKRLCNMAASEAKIDTAALFGYGRDGKQVCNDL